MEEIMKNFANVLAVLLLVVGGDAHPGEEALVAVVVDRDDLVVEQVEQGDHGGLAAHLRLIVRAHVSLDGDNCVVKVCYCLSLSHLAHKSVAVL